MRIKQLLFSALLIIGRIVIASPSSNDVVVLRRDTWSFSEEEMKTLNKCTAESLEKTLLPIINDATGHVIEGRLMSFRVVDLNNDGIAEVLACIDYSGRGVIRDVALLSRKSGQYYQRTIPAYGGTIKLVRKENQNLVVGSLPLFELTGADPIQAFPMLYSWTGCECRDVSRENRAFYASQYLPVLTNALYCFQGNNLIKGGEAQRRFMIEAINCGLAIEKLNSMFNGQLVLTNEVAKLNNLMKSFVGDGEADAMILKKFIEVRGWVHRSSGER